ncbi:MAG: betaine/proline/choline family ABC transporter ATP-binding protein [Rhodospirillaceae bacterium]|jgi:glycine betaine/proline transport system ATP-binding protein|nr:betaine/proline/choline family ABC transporter ATP-binding protein [Rhodospirillaceae bacterium]MBT5242099.1 betaine/proline/choline family ABC transporter ATP-binding protein [Rhodospirillaceae bacterium]MBT5565825.1 betaine/proline/choline family ABC transporter ATP-binding protein [Rhodospirillaceae bacterium]MBT6090282.1 betaine/proline/choline family ABC transporter ATP-binding protein [Rhodospirillaceae bacterium]
MSRIALDRVTKVFGRRVDDALALSRDRVGASEIREQTGATVALAETSLNVAAGEVFMIMGLSGSGKSTLLRLINRLIDPSSGRVAIDGTDINALSPAELRAVRRDRLAMVFQGFGLLPHRTVADNVGFGLEVQGVSEEARHSAVADWITRVGLDGFTTALPHELSGGMRQRVGLARALAAGADILLMDEPFSALDPLIRREMQGLLADLQRDLGKTIVFVTHDLSEAIRLGSRIAILKDGRIIQVGTGAEIVDAPADDYVRAFTEDLRT